MGGTNGKAVDHAIMTNAARGGEEAPDRVDAGVVCFLADEHALYGIAPGEGLGTEAGAKGEERVGSGGMDISEADEAVHGGGDD